MSKEAQKSNFELAQEEANKIDLQIIDTLQKGYNFRVEAGAGSGKTYSLNKVIEWIQVNKWKQYRKKNQHVVCITYTNAAVDVISGRLTNDSFIIPSTIHSFAWNAIKQYQSTLIKIISEDETLWSTEGDFFAIRKVEYTLGHRYNENGIMYLYHDDVIRLFAALLDNAKFRRVFSDKYPLILIDEYQDSLKPIIDRFLEYFISLNSGPQFGFFGDSWQTIYQSNKAYPQDKEAAYIRNRNLFYVCCSRPKKRLYFFVSVPVDRVFRKFLAEMVGEDNILTYSEFLNSQNHSKTE